MINLLPSSEQSRLRAGLDNVLLLRYVIMSAIVFGVLLALFGLTFVFMKATEMSSITKIETNQAKAASYADVEAKATAFKNNLSQAKQIMDKETQYTKLLTAFASQLPKGVVMDQIALDASTFGTPSTIQLKAKTYTDAIALKSSFQESKMFKDVSFSSISRADNYEGQYPYSVQLNVIIVNPKDSK